MMLSDHYSTRPMSLSISSRRKGFLHSVVVDYLEITRDDLEGVTFVKAFVSLVQMHLVEMIKGDLIPELNYLELSMERCLLKVNQAVMQVAQLGVLGNLEVFAAACSTVSLKTEDGEALSQIL